MSQPTPQAESAARCPFAGAVSGNAKAGRRSNRDWWPEQLNLSILHQHSAKSNPCLLYTSPSPRDRTRSRMPSSA